MTTVVVRRLDALAMAVRAGGAGSRRRLAVEVGDRREAVGRALERRGGVGGADGRTWAVASAGGDAPRRKGPCDRPHARRATRTPRPPTTAAPRLRRGEEPAATARDAAATCRGAIHVSPAPVAALRREPDRRTAPATDRTRARAARPSLGHASSSASIASALAGRSSGSFESARMTSASTSAGIGVPRGGLSRMGRAAS